jgi:hypothetical protein
MKIKIPQMKSLSAFLLVTVLIISVAAPIMVEGAPESNPPKPRANPDFYSTPINTTLFVSADEGVLQNDTSKNNNLNAYLVNKNLGPFHGTLDFNSNGSFTIHQTQTFRA